MDEYYQVQTLDPKKLPIIQRADLADGAVDARSTETSARPTARRTRLRRLPAAHRRLHLRAEGRADPRRPAHPRRAAERRAARSDLLLALTRLDNAECRACARALAAALDLDVRRAAGAIAGRRSPARCRRCWRTPDRRAAVRSHGDVIERLEVLGTRAAVSELQADAASPVDGRRSRWSSTTPSRRRRTAMVVRDVAATIVDVEQLAPDLRPHHRRDRQPAARPRRRGTCRPGRAARRRAGMANVLPTGRNFYSVDPNTIPSPTAWEVGQSAGRRAARRSTWTRRGATPRPVGIVVWGTSAMRTHGDDVAEILYLLGVRPSGSAENRRVRGLEVIPLAELGRPRIDVTVRISGFFRDAFPNLVHLLDEAVGLVADARRAGRPELRRGARPRRRGGASDGGRPVARGGRASRRCTASSAASRAPTAPASCRCSTSATGRPTRTSPTSTRPGAATPTRARDYGAEATRTSSDQRFARSSWRPRTRTTASTTSSTATTTSSTTAA